MYDAVAGRAGYEGFLTAWEEQQQSKHRNRTAALPPDEVLFRRKGAPVRYEEDDVYSADRHLSAHQRLPDSDLLKAIHAYSADFYSSAFPQDMDLDMQSMDETALLAMGILLEEAAVEKLGCTGDLAFVESADSDAGPAASDGVYLHRGRWRRSVIEEPSIGRGIKHGDQRSQPKGRHRVAMRSKPGQEDGGDK